MPEIALSESDKRLLRAMQADATLSLKALAEQAGMSASSVWRRVREFEEAGLVRERVTVLDPLKLGLTVCNVVNVNITRHDAEARRSFERWVAQTPAVLQCLAVTGAHDYMLIVRTPTVEDYERFLTQELLAQPSVAQSATHLVLRQHKDSNQLPI